MLGWIKQHRWKSFFLATITLILLALPIILQSVVQKAVYDYTQPYGIKAVTLDDIDLNVFTGQLEISQLSLYQQAIPKEQSEPNIKPITTIGLFTVNISLWDLLDSKIHIEELGFKDALLPFELDADNQLSLAGIPLTQQQQDEEQQSSAMALQPGLDRLLFENIELSLTSQDKTNHFQLEELSLDNFYAWSENPARLELKSTIDDSPLSATLQLHLFSQQPKIVGTVRTSELNSDNYLHLIPQQQFSFGSKLTTDITFTLQQTKQGLKLFQQGNIDLLHPHYSQDKTQAKLEKLSWKGDFHFTDNSEQSILLNGELNLQSAALQQNPYQAQFKQAQLKGTADITLAEVISIQLAENFSVSGLNLQDQSKKQQLQANIRSSFNSQLSIAEQTIKVQHQGDLTLSKLSGKQQQLTAQAAELKWQGKINATQAKTLDLKSSGQLSASGLNLQDPANELSLKTNLNSSYNNTVNIQDENLTLQHQGKLALRNLSSQYQELVAKINSLDWQGDFNAKQNKTLDFNSSGQVGLKNLKVLNSQTKLNIANSDSIELKQIKLQNTDSIDATGLIIRGFELAQQGKLPGLVKLKQLNLDSASFKQTDTQQQLNIGKLIINGSETHITLSKDNKLTQVDSLLASLPGESERQKQTKSVAQQADKATDKIKPSFQYQLSELQIKGKNPVYLTYHKVQPVLKKTLSLDKFILQQLASDKPQQASRFDLQITLDEFSKLTSKGKITPLDPTRTLQASTKLDGLSLLDLSPLSENTVGYHIKSGQLSAELETKLNNNQIDADNQLHLHKFELQSMDSEKSQKLQQGFPIPLETGLAMLQDKNDNIDLSLPVKGDISKPDFNVSDVISKALGKALAGATRTYLLLALQPFGAIAMAGEMALDQASAISLQAVEFQAGSKQLTPQMQSYLGKIHKLLSERKAVQIKLCDGASEADRVVLAEQANQAAAKQQRADLEQAIKAAKNAQERRAALDAFQNQQTSKLKVSDQQLLQLAEERQKTVKRQLMKLGVASKQLIICKPKISQDKQKALVNLNI